jgi:hypothetical protein
MNEDDGIHELGVVALMAVILACALAMGGALAWWLR